MGLLGMNSLFAQQEQAKDSLLGSSISLEEVSVAGLRANNDQPVPFSEVTKEDLASRNLGQDLPILLNFLPAVVTTSDAGAGIGYTGIRVRGSDATRVNVTINGIPYNDTESQGTFWVNLARFCLLRRKHTVAAGSGHIHQWIKCLWGELKYFDQCRNFKSLCRNHQRNRQLQYPSSYPKILHRAIKRPY